MIIVACEGETAVDGRHRSLILAASPEVGSCPYVVIPDDLRKVIFCSVDASVVVPLLRCRAQTRKAFDIEGWNIGRGVIERRVVHSVPGAGQVFESQRSIGREAAILIDDVS